MTSGCRCFELNEGVDFITLKAAISDFFLVRVRLLILANDRSRRVEIRRCFAFALHSETKDINALSIERLTG